VDEAESWALIERSGRETRDRDERARWLTENLAALSPVEIEDFQVQMDRLRNRVDTWQMWGAATVILRGWCSDDGFWYFQTWLIGQGRETFERAAVDPDALTDVPAVRALAGRPRREWGEEWPGWEELGYVAEDAHGDSDTLFDALTRRGHWFRSSPAPADEEWDLSDRTGTTRRYPRLSALFASGDVTQRRM
jgi:hypothetical protein